MKTAEEMINKKLGSSNYFFRAEVKNLMQEYAELIAFDFQKYRKKKLGFAFSDERLKAEFDEYKKTIAP